VDAGPVSAIAVAVILFTVGHFLLPSRAKRRARRIERALAAQPRSWIGEARGPVRVTGRIQRDGELLEAPLSGRACVLYEVVVDAVVNQGGTGQWRRYLDLRGARPFLLADESGTARIDTSGPYDLALVHDRAGMTSGEYPGEHRALSVLLESLDLKPTNWLGRWRPIHYAEAVLEQGALVSVGGNSVRELDQSGDSAGPRSPPERVVLRGTEAQPLLIGHVRGER